MRLAATVSVTLIALSTAALAQVAERSAVPTSNNMLENASEPSNGALPVPDSIDDAPDATSNMLSDSASPPPTEPK